MTDIRNMSEDELTLLNKGNRRPTGIIKMSETKIAPTKLKKTKVKNPTPAYTNLEDASDEDVAAALAATRSKSEFSRAIEQLETGKGVKASGDIIRLRQKLSVLAKKSGKKFIARQVEDSVVIVRVEV